MAATLLIVASTFSIASGFRMRTIGYIMYSCCESRLGTNRLRNVICAAQAAAVECRLISIPPTVNGWRMKKLSFSVFPSPFRITLASRQYPVFENMVMFFFYDR